MRPYIENLSPRYQDTTPYVYSVERLDSYYFNSLIAMTSFMISYNENDKFIVLSIKILDDGTNYIYAEIHATSAKQFLQWFINRRYMYLENFSPIFSQSREELNAYCQKHNLTGGIYW